jgi:hypothetical protein
MEAVQDAKAMMCMNTADLEKRANYVTSYGEEDYSVTGV